MEPDKKDRDQVEDNLSGKRNFCLASYRLKTTDQTMEDCGLGWLFSRSLMQWMNPENDWRFYGNA